MMNAESLISDKVILRGIVKPELSECVIRSCTSMTIDELTKLPKALVM